MGRFWSPMCLTGRSQLVRSRSQSATASRRRQGPYERRGLKLVLAGLLLSWLSQRVFVRSDYSLLTNLSDLPQVCGQLHSQCPTLADGKDSILADLSVSH